MQVKYRTARAGAITVHFRSVWNDRQGTHTRPTDKSAIDVVCIYCPETDACYYIRPSAHRASVTLRIAPSRNGQRNGVIDALAFRSLADALSPAPPSELVDSDAAPFVQHP
jgi:hypothetical protein